MIAQFCNSREGAAVAQWQHIGLQVKRSSDRSCTWGMIRYKFHLISPGCPQPSIALQCRTKPKTPFIPLYQGSLTMSVHFQCRIVAQNTIHSFIHSFITVLIKLLISHGLSVQCQCSLQNIDILLLGSSCEGAKYILILIVYHYAGKTWTKDRHIIKTGYQHGGQLVSLEAKGSKCLLA